MAKSATKEPKAKKPRKARPTKQMALNEIEELLGKIEKAEERVARAEMEWNAAKEEAKTEKGVWLNAVKELRELCQMRKKWARERKNQPLLEQAEKKSAEVKPQDASPTAAEVTAAVAGADDKDGWRTKTIDALDLPPGLLTKLANANILTLGDFAKFQAEHGDHWVADLKGVGSAAAERISDAWIAFWKANPQYGDGT